MEDLEMIVTRFYFYITDVHTDLAYSVSSHSRHTALHRKRISLPHESTADGILSFSSFSFKRFIANGKSYVIWATTTVGQQVSMTEGK